VAPSSAENATVSVNSDSGLAVPEVPAQAIEPTARPQTPAPGVPGAKPAIPTQQPTPPLSTSLESRVQKLEEKLDIILKHLPVPMGADPTPWRTSEPASSPSPRRSAAQDRPSHSRVIPLRHLQATDLQSMFESIGTSNVRVRADANTNSLHIESSAEQPGAHSAIESLIRRMDSGPEAPADPLSTARNTSRAWPTTSATKDRDPAADVAPVPQIDVVTLGTSRIDAQAALRLARATVDRMKKLGSSAVANHELLAAEINLEAAQRKLNLLTSIAQSGLAAAKAEYAAAEANLAHTLRLHEKGFITSTQLEIAKARVAAAQGRLDSLSSIME
jgi:hypothetical protein